MKKNEKPTLLYLYTRLSNEADYKEIAFPGGAQLRFFQLAQHFSNNGYQVIAGTDDPEDSKAVIELTQAGIIHHRIPFTRPTPWSVLKCMANIVGLVQKAHSLIIHSHHRRTTFLSIPAAKISGVPRIHNARGSLNDKRYFGALAGKNIISVSEGTKKNLIEVFKIPTENITVIHNGVDIEEATKAKTHKCKLELDLEPEARVATFVGRVSEQKGLIYLIRALPSILNQFPLFRLLLVGRVPEQKFMDKLAAEIDMLDIAHAVRFVGHQSSVSPYIGMSEFTVLPSLQEGLPGVVIESLLLGRPVVATAVDGTPEIIKHQWNGLLVSPAEVEQLSAAIIQMLKDPEETKFMGVHGRERAQKMFSVERMLQKYAAYYSKLLNG